MNTDMSILNHLKSDFMKYADSFEPSTWEISLNEIKGQVNGFRREDEPIILLDCSEGEENWFLCTNTIICSDSIIEDYQKGEIIYNPLGVIRYYPLEELTDEQIYEIRRIVESWLVKKDMGNLFS